MCEIAIRIIWMSGYSSTNAVLNKIKHCDNWFV